TGGENSTWHSTPAATVRRIRQVPAANPLETPPSEASVAAGGSSSWIRRATLASLRAWHGSKLLLRCQATTSMSGFSEMNASRWWSSTISPDRSKNSPGSVGPCPTSRCLATRASAVGSARPISPRAATCCAGSWRRISAGAKVESCAFSIVSIPPEELSPGQRRPHFDATDPNLMALLHFAGDSATGGTAFYRHRRTGFETIRPDRLVRFTAAIAEDEREHGPLPARYFHGDDP